MALFDAAGFERIAVRGFVLPAKRYVDGDGDADIFWRNYTTGENTVWIMNGTTYDHFLALVSEPDTAWKIEAVGDLK